MIPQKRTTRLPRRFFGVIWRRSFHSIRGALFGSLRIKGGDHFHGKESLLRFSKARAGAVEANRAALEFVGVAQVLPAALLVEAHQISD